jgi:hypothetical protein
MLIIVDIKASTALLETLLNTLPLTTDNNIFLGDSKSIIVSPLISLYEYELIRLEIQKRVQESWYTNTFAVVVAVLNLANLIVGAFTYFTSIVAHRKITIILQMSKEIIFLLIVFCYCAELNAKAIRFNDKLGSYLAWHEKPMHVWHYACLNPISFELGGYAVTWSRIGWQLLSVAIGVGVGLLRQAEF